MFLLRCLGQFHLEYNQQPIPLPTRKTAALLVYLVLHPEVHDRERLVTCFWGDFADEQARRSLRTALSALRKALGEECVLADRETVQFNPTFPLWVDAVALGDQLQQFRVQPVVEPTLVDLTLYQGDLLDGFYDEWILRKREELRLAYLRVLERLAQHWRTAGDYGRTLEIAQQMLRMEPAAESAHQHLLFCYTVAGDRQAAHQQYEACVRALWEELAVEPTPETVALYRRSQQAPIRTRSAAALQSNLPIPFASFIGRTREIAKLKALLRGDHATAAHPPVRLVTVTGPGGCGKTRLAIAVARELLDAYFDGIWWVELAALTEGAQVAQAVAKVLDVQQGVHPALLDGLIGHLRPKQLLLVLDNCEHLIEACAELAVHLLRHCLDIQILATSRETLGIFGETGWLVPSLTLPNTQPDSPAAYLDFEAIRLFVERASAAQRDFTLTTANAPAILQICRQLDGIPLAIELAAVRVKLMTVEQLATRLTGAIGARFELLTAGGRTVLPRHQTLQAAMAWSYALLSEPEQQLLQQLSVCVGGWTLEAAEAVGASNGEQPVALVLARLVDKSLVLAEPQGEVVRYQMLETIRQYAQEQLAKTGATVAAHDRHLHYCLHLAEAAALHFRTPQQVDWLERLAVEHANLRTALAWAVASRQPTTGARLGIALWRFWYIRGYYEEGWQWLERLLALTTAPEQRANLLYGQGMLARRRRESAAAVECFTQSLALFRQLADTRGIASALRGLGFMYYQSGDFIRARPLAEEALLLFRTLADHEGIAVTLDTLAYIALDPEETERLCQESLALRRRSGNLHGITTSLAGLAYTALDRADYTAARTYLREHLQINEALGNRDGIANAFSILGITAYAEGDYATAQHFYEKILKFYQETGDRTLLPVARYGLGRVALKRDEVALAHTHFAQALSLYQAMNALPEVLLVLGYLAAAKARQGATQRTLTLFGAVAALRVSVYIEYFWFEQTELDAAHMTARQSLNAEAADAAWAAGAAMTLAEAVAYALTPS